MSSFRSPLCFRTLLGIACIFVLAAAASASEVLRLTLRQMPDADLVRRIEQDLARAAAGGVKHALLEISISADTEVRLDAAAIEGLRAACGGERQPRLFALHTWPGGGPAAALLCAALGPLPALEGCASFRSSAGAVAAEPADIEAFFRTLGVAEPAQRAAAIARLGQSGAASITDAEARAWGWIDRVVADRETALRELTAIEGPWNFRDPAEFQSQTIPAPGTKAEPASQVESQAAKKVLRVMLRGTVDDAMVGQVHRALAQAREVDTELVAIDIDTPGGAVVSMWAIAEAIGAYDGEGRRIVAYVTNHAISAGMVIALSCGTIWMRENSSIGAATPVMAGPSGIEAPGDEGRTDSAEKIMSFFRADVRKLAQKVRGEGSNAILLAEAMVDRSISLVAFETKEGEVFIYPHEDFERLKKEGKISDREGRVLEVWDETTLVTLTHGEAARYGFADGVVTNFEKMLEREDLSGAMVEELHMSWSEELVRAIADWAFMIFLAACVLAYVEFKLPGFGLPGVSSVLLFALLFFGKYLGGVAEVQEILLFFVGLALIAVEVFVFPGTFFFGAAGLVCAVLGLFLSFHGFMLPSNEFETSAALGNIGAFLAAITGTVLFSLLFGRFLPKIPFFGRLISVPSGATATTWNEADEVATSSWIGRRGRVLTDLRPAGKVRLGGTVFDVISDGEYVSAGTEVEVVRAEGVRLIVIPARAPRA